MPRVPCRDVFPGEAVFDRLQYRWLCALGVLLIVLVAVNIGLSEATRKLQGLVSARAQYLQQTVTIREFYQDLARALADLAVKNNDEQVRALLEGEGFHLNPPSATPAAPERKP
jgi:hypothetical protein